MKPSQSSLIHIHKLPPKLTELLKTAENTPVVGFGKTQEQRDFMLISAILENQDPEFFKKLTKEVKEYFSNLNEACQ
ncbi:hypothetical protein [Colwellia sp. E150_009]